MKTASLDDESYRLLKGTKFRTLESFRMVVKRLLGSCRSIDDRAGAWSDMTEQKVDRLRRETGDTFGS